MTYRDLVCRLPYDSDNVSDSRLAFRQATAEPLYHQQDDTYCMKTLYGLRRDRPCVQDVGSVATKAGRCVAFPNLYQHRVSPFELTESHRPGVRRILVFFLVDPSCRIPSATEVPPQQEVWLKHTMYTARSSPHSRLAQLPVELVDAQIALTPGIMSSEEALQTRKELMNERTVRLPDGGETDDEDDFDDASVFTGLDEDDLFSHTFNMCEH
ncbi:hypothetical protein BD626DRAFT_573010 [Schizophyllum amplum]|uniref:DUF4246 domain-containing protein n=1 Tax=Schizophyllum amplum TaxID=97359 RepID=A0A550C2G1_9AGAR|nr:hypothetical protein BD626DRAFT_573010 [Auriculariopsis ampla]